MVQKVPVRYAGKFVQIWQIVCGTSSGLGVIELLLCRYLGSLEWDVLRWCWFLGDAYLHRARQDLHQNPPIERKTMSQLDNLKDIDFNNLSLADHEKIGEVICTGFSSAPVN